jgi:tetratricopeptide (TPR) repeat protein
MQSHKFIWLSTGLIVVLALGLSLRSTTPVEPVEINQPPSDTAIQEDLIRQLKIQLPKDWRVRRSKTQYLVEQLASLNVRSETENEFTWFAQGLVMFYREENWEKALNAFNKSVQINPDWIWSRELKAIVLFRMGDREQAKIEFDRIVQLAPNWSRSYSDKAILHRLDGELAEAEEYALQALEMDENNPLVHYNYGVVKDFGGNRMEARAYYEHALSLDRDLPAAYYNLACGYAVDGHENEALRLLAESIELERAFYREAAKDEDFDSIRSGEGFQELMGKYRP